MKLRYEVLEKNVSVPDNSEGWLFISRLVTLTAAAVGSARLLIETTVLRRLGRRTGGTLVLPLSTYRREWR
jgi:hypothetical protein